MDRPSTTEADVSSVYVASFRTGPDTQSLTRHERGRRQMGKNMEGFDRYIFCTHKRPQKQRQQQQKHINIFAVNFMVQNCYYLPVILL